MLGFGLNAKEDNVIYGNRTDVCFLCAEKMIKNEEAPDRVAAEEKLRGTFTNKPLFRLPIPGHRYVIYQDCLERALNDIKAETNA